MLTALLLVLFGDFINIQPSANDMLDKEIGITRDFMYAVDTRLHVPIFVIATIDARDLLSENNRASYWSTKWNTKSIPRNANTLYRGSGYDRGHILASSLSYLSPSTFMFCMAAPQHPASNRYEWYSVERAIKRTAAEYGWVQFIGGTGFTPDEKIEWLDSEENGIAIPDFWWAVIVLPDGSTKQWIVYNTPTQPHIRGEYAYRVSMNVICTMVGLEFLEDIGN